MTGLCECGCGEATNIAPRNYHAQGIRKGEPMRFRPGHHLRVIERKPPSAETRAKMGASQKRRFADPEERARHASINVGRVQTDEHKAKVSAALRGRTFSSEHLAKLSIAGKARTMPTGSNAYRWKGDDASYGAIHRWMKLHYPKTGICECCGRNVGTRGQAGTHYAFRHHSEPYTRNREDYIEMCPACHNARDKGGNYKPGWAV